MLNLDHATDPEWPEPQPLTAKIDSVDYPIDALPDTIRNAVTEVQSYVQAPIPLVASSAISAMSLAAQAHVDIQRAEKLEGPSGLYFLTLADSGERKTTCDGFFTKVIRDYENEQAEAAKPEIERYEAALSAWNAEREGILQAIKNAGKTGKPTNELNRDLTEHQHDKPEPPKIPKLLMGDETPENLAWRLAEEWPSGAIISSEAGSVLGSHSMGKDSIMRNLSLYNVLWDGGTHEVGRRTSESFIVSGARLTVGLQIQEATLREFFEKSGKLARGTGFLARFLIAWPQSTQGLRLYTESLEHWPALAAFNRRITEILNQPAPIEDGKLKPVMLTLSKDAKAAWIKFHDSIETNLANGKELHDIRDVASKAADNAARLAALFHVFDYGASKPVGYDSFESASRIVAWHLHESRRFFGELALPVEMADAARLDSYLIDYCKRENTHMVNKRQAQQYGPIRKKDKLENAIKELCELDRVNVLAEGKKIMLRVNPLLLQRSVATVASVAVAN